MPAVAAAVGAAAGLEGRCGAGTVRSKPITHEARMRLIPRQIHAIRQFVHSRLGEDARLWLFGSRVDEQRRGGDVDLLAEPARPVPLTQWLACRSALADALDLKVDLLLRQPGEPDQPIYRIARATGVPLWPSGSMASSGRCRKELRSCSATTSA